MRQQLVNVLSVLSFLIAFIALACGLRSCEKTNHYIWDTAGGGTRILRLSEGTIELYSFTAKLPPTVKRGSGWTITNKRVVVDHDWDALVLWGVRNTRAANERDQNIWQTAWDTALGVEIVTVVLAFCLLPLFRISSAIRKRDPGARTAGKMPDCQLRFHHLSLLAPWYPAYVICRDVSGSALLHLRLL